MNPPNSVLRGVTPELLAFCRQLDPSRELIRVAVKPLPEAIPGNHFGSLKSHVESAGGKLQFGWVIWENSGWYLEAQFHGVWQSPDGTLVDIDPIHPNASAVWFLPESRRTFQGESIPNRFEALSRSPEVQSVVEHAELMARLKADAETQARRAGIAPATVGRNDPCPCGSGLKYKKCCGRGAGAR